MRYVPFPADKQNNHAYPLKLWWLPPLLAPHADIVNDTDLQTYLEEFSFLHNRRKTHGMVHRS
jgi:hypothetical protein